MLKQLFMTFMILTLTPINIAISSNCYDEHKPGEEHAPTTKKKLSDKEKKEVLSLLETNEKLHWAFFKYNGKEVEKIAKEAAEKIDKISNKEIKKLLGFAQKQARALVHKRPQKENNQSYHMFSMGMIHIINSYELGDKYQGYRCPMVRKQWVQNTKKLDKVHNPYAAYMPHCGEKIEPPKKKEKKK